MYFKENFETIENLDNNVSILTELIRKNSELKHIAVRKFNFIGDLTVLLYNFSLIILCMLLAFHFILLLICGCYLEAFLVGCIICYCIVLILYPPSIYIMCVICVVIILALMIYFIKGTINSQKNIGTETNVEIV